MNIIKSYKLYVLGIVSIIYTSIFYSSTTLKERVECNISFTPLWIPLDDKQHSKLFGDSMWVAVGKLSLYMKHPTFLPSLTLRWKGKEPLAIQSASLYSAQGYTIIPTDQYLIQDAYIYYNNGIQELVFPACSKKLHVSNTFYLTLTLSYTGLNKLPEGHFELVPDILPFDLQKALHHKPLQISCGPQVPSVVVTA